MPTVNIKDIPEPKMIKLVDLSEDSINHIAEIVVSKLNKSVRHGHWVTTATGWIYCSNCGGEPPNEINYRSDYCPNCGAKMDEVTHG